MHSKVRVMATAYQPVFNNPVVILNIYPRGIQGMRQRGYVYKLRETKRHLTADGVLELEYDTSWSHNPDLHVRPDVIRVKLQFGVETIDNQKQRVRLVRLKLVGALERTMEIPVLKETPPEDLRPRGIYRKGSRPGASRRPRTPGPLGGPRRLD